MMTGTIDVAIVGSGPAAVSAAQPLVEAGLRVLMVHPGEPPTIPETDEHSYWDLRTRDENQWKWLLGSGFEALAGNFDESPKLRVPRFKPVFEGYEAEYRISARNFQVHGSLATGGLSNAWGAGVAKFDDEDLADFPVDRSELENSYNRVTARIGVSGTAPDNLTTIFGSMPDLNPPTPLCPAATHLLARYQKSKARLQALTIDRGRNAVLTEDRGLRRACNESGLCLWGCGRNSIYSAIFDVAALTAHSNFLLRNHSFVDEIRTDGQRCRLIVRDRRTARVETIDADHIVLAAGAIGTGKLVAGALQLFDTEIRLLSNPTVGFALLLPRLIGQPTPRRFYGAAQLSYRYAHEDGDYGFGNVFASASLPMSEFLRRSPLSLPVSRAMLRLLLPSMLLANCFLPGRLGRHLMALRQDGGLMVEGRYAPELPQWLEKAKRAIAGDFRRLGAFLVPGSFIQTQPGADMHYAGTVPMSHKPLPHQTWPDGSVAGLPGVYVVDAANFPSLPARPPTLTAMANADRISRVLADRLKQGRPIGAAGR